MTNAMIILLESVKLMEAGVIQPTGVKIMVDDGNGGKKELDMPEEIHTFAGWKSRGFKVKKGEKAVAKFPVWTYKVSMSKKEAQLVDDDAEDHIEGAGKMYMKISAFFTRGQVEEIKK